MSICVYYYYVFISLALSQEYSFGFALMASYFSLFVQRKVTKRKDTPISLPYGFPQHSPLPTGRPDSPSGLDMTKSDVPVVFSLPKPNASANFMGEIPYKRRDLDVTKYLGCNSEAYCTARIRRITASA